MENIDLKAVGELVRSLGPSDEHRQKFGQTFLGTLLGQATVSILMAVAYLVAIVAFATYWKAYVQPLREVLGDTLFWVVVIIPFLCILVFSMAPTFWRARRERRLKATGIGGNVQFNPGYFRLFPFRETDRQEFKRLDGADIKILNWVGSAKTSMLYLSGASGVGKSSLLAANVVPKLREIGWIIIEARLFGDPVERLRSAVLSTEGLFTRQPAAHLPLRELLHKAAEAAAKTGHYPLLVVVDQFEEFLILHTEAERAAFANFLGDLNETPIDGVRLLLVFRSDYRSLVFKLNLPPLAAGKNWEELGSYDRGEATAFLQGGGRELSPEALDSLLRGLDRIEDAFGLYRPITLNMVGLVLERMGPTLEGDPTRLIQAYLTSCLTASESRDFAKPLLARMISDAGTKEPRSEADLANFTHFEPWQVSAALTDLARRGLVRRLDGTTPIWEVAHDFLARTIGQLIGRLKPTVYMRVQPLVAPVVLLAWVALAVWLLPYFLMVQERSAESHLRWLGASFQGPDDQRFEERIVVRFPHGFEGTLAEARSDLARLTGPIGVVIDPGKRKFLTDTNITTLEPLKGLMNISSLYVKDAKYVRDLEPLKGLTNLRGLSFANASLISSLEPLKGLTNLRGLGISDAPRITSLAPLAGLTNLRVLVLRDAAGLTSLEPLKSLANLERFELTGASGITDLEPLKGLTNLREIDLTGANGITTLTPLKGRKFDSLVASPELLATMN